MLNRLVKSALKTGCLSVEAEGLIRQLSAIRGYSMADRAALEELTQAVQKGQVKREAQGNLEQLLQPKKICR